MSARLKILFTSKHDKSVGFIGLGKMGTPMARNLIKAGFDVTVYDTDATKLHEFTRRTINIEELAASNTRIISMLPNNGAVEDTYLKSLLSTAAKEGTTFIDCSTVSPDLVVGVEKKYRQLCLHFIDAPVSGGVKGAQQGNLSFLVGGDPSIIEQNQDVLLAMGKKIIPCGRVGNGQIAKICNNLILGVSMVALSESLNLGVHLGLDPRVLSKVINSSSGRSWASELYNPVPGLMEDTPASNNYEGGFAAKLMIKDLGLALEEARKCGVAIPTAETSERLYQRMLREMKDFEAKDFSSIFKFIESKRA